MYQKSTLSNGLRMLTVPMPHVRSVTVACFFGAGSRYESDAEAGLSHYLEHMLFKGTKKRPLPQQISEAIEGIGGFMNASTDREITIYWAKVARHHFATAADLLADIILHSVFKPAEVERERKVILEEIGSINDSPQQLVDLLIDTTMWPGQALGRDVGGTKESVSALSRRAMLDYLARQYAPNNCVVAVAGDITHEEVVNVIGEHLGKWKRSKPRTWFPAKKGQRAPRASLKSQKTEQAHLCIAFPGLSSKHPDRYALDMLNVVMGEGMSSRLFLEIREKLGLAYDVHSYASHFLDDGALTLYAGVEPKNIDRTIGAALSVLESMKEPVPEHEMHKAKEMTKGRLLLRTEDTRSMAGWVGAQELLRNEVVTIDDVVGIVDAMTPEAVQAVAKRIITPAKRNLAIVGPFRTQARFERLIAR